MTAPNILVPSKPKTNGAAGVGSQKDRRFTDTFFDNHRHPRFPNGRPFTGQREFTSGTDRESVTAGFISTDLQRGQYFHENIDFPQTQEERLASLASAWDCPWLPSGGKKFMQFNYRNKRITWDYVKGETEERQALDRYYRAAAKVAGANGWGEIKFGVMPSYQVTSILGEPTKFLPIWQAARAGDPWLLGFVDEPNEQLAAILGVDVQYVGGYTGDSAYVGVQRPAAPQPLLTPEKVLATTDMDALAKMIAAAVEASLTARDEAKKAANNAKMANVRANRKPLAKATA